MFICTVYNVTAILCDVFYKDKLKCNIILYTANLSVKMHCDHNLKLFYFGNNNSLTQIDIFSIECK